MIFRLWFLAWKYSGMTWLLNTITFVLHVITGPFDLEDSSALAGGSCRTVRPSPLPLTTLLCKTNDFGHRLCSSHSFSGCRDTKASRQRIDLFSKRTWIGRNNKNSSSWFFLTQWSPPVSYFCFVLLPSWWFLIKGSLLMLIFRPLFFILDPRESSHE